MRVGARGGHLGALADEYAPKGGHAFHGVSDTGYASDLFEFSDQVEAHQAVLQDFFHWRVPLTTGALYRWGATDTRGVLSLSTAPGGGAEVITPRQIARGRDDRYVLRLARTIEETGQTVYIRLMAGDERALEPLLGLQRRRLGARPRSLGALVSQGVAALRAAGSRREPKARQRAPGEEGHAADSARRLPERPRL